MGTFVTLCESAFFIIIVTFTPSPYYVNKPQQLPLLEFDWKANALEKAKSYAETMAMSDSAIYDQLTSEYGEKFTAEEAQYAIDNLE